MTECLECGFVYESVGLDEIPVVLRDLGSRFSDRVGGVDDAILRRRPDPAVWSPLEYLCHVRDVFLIQRDRAVLALIEDRPSFPRMYRDERADLAHYVGESPGKVVHDQLRVAAELVAWVFSGRFPDEWRRQLIYNYPEPMERDLAWLARHTVHEGEHHLLDLDRILAQSVRRG
jgi:S-DNA-T family DNA segregation ATPase FtsK/SpoIIIE